MITGYNTDVDFKGTVYHVQTEDRGLDNPIVESLVYTGGEIVTSRKTPYSDLIEADAAPEQAVLARMETQHRELIREIRNGEFSNEELKPFGHGIVTNRRFDEVVLAFLEEEIDLEAIRLDVSEPDALIEGASSTLHFRVSEEATDRPIADATVVVRLVATDREALQLFSAPTDESGEVEAAIEIPTLPGADATLVCEVDARGRRAELKRAILAAEASPNVS